MSETVTYVIRCVENRTYECSRTSYLLICKVHNKTDQQNTNMFENFKVKLNRILEYILDSERSEGLHSFTVVNFFL